MNADDIVFVMLLVAGITAFNQWRSQPEPRTLRLPAATLVLVGITAVVASLAIFDPALTDALRRDPLRLAEGEWWRLATAHVTPDGIEMLVLNLVALLVLGGAAENLAGPRSVLVASTLAAVTGELSVNTVMPGGGAGTAAGTGGSGMLLLGIVGLLAATALPSALPANGMAGMLLLGGVVVLVAWDAHAVAFWTGFVVGIVPVWPRIRASAGELVRWLGEVSGRPPRAGGTARPS